MIDDDGRDAEQEAWANQLMLERERMAMEALNRCAAAGADPKDVETLARECGLKWTGLQSSSRGETITNERNNEWVR